MTNKKDIFPHECYIIDDELTDYSNFVPRSATKEQRAKFDIGDLFINGAVCLKCKEFVRSRNRHDFRECKCGAVTVDGGSWYARRVGEPEDYIDVIEKFYK